MPNPSIFFGSPIFSNATLCKHQQSFPHHTNLEINYYSLWMKRFGREKAVIQDNILSTMLWIINYNLPAQDKLLDFHVASLLGPTNRIKKRTAILEGNSRGVQWNTQISKRHSIFWNSQFLSKEFHLFDCTIRETNSRFSSIRIQTWNFRTREDLQNFFSRGNINVSVYDKVICNLWKLHM